MADILPHYRWVSYIEKSPSRKRGEDGANRVDPIKLDFGAK